MIQQVNSESSHFFSVQYLSINEFWKQSFVVSTL